MSDNMKNADLQKLATEQAAKQMADVFIGDPSMLKRTVNPLCPMHNGGAWHGIIPPPCWCGQQVQSIPTPFSMVPARGWECPRCQQVNAPHVSRCDCRPAQWTVSFKCDAESSCGR